MVLAMWVAILAVAFGFFFWATGMVKQEQVNDRFDAGLAILEFARAYPNEAIRNLVMTADGEMVFLRLWTGGTGCMRRISNRYLCNLIEPERVSTTLTPDSRGIMLEFFDLKPLSGSYYFRTEKEAAEVSLWLLGAVAVRAESMNQPA